MPILNETGDSGLEYVADGLTDSLISKLSQLSKLTVKARSSVFRYKGREIRPLEVREQLGVDALLIGRLARREEDLELRFDLVDARTGNEIWGDRFESMESEIRTLENSVSLALVEALRTTATDDERTKLTKQHTGDPKAFGHYLKGRFFWNKRTPENFRNAIREFSSAVEIDPAFVPAYLGLADSYVLLENYSGSRTSDSLPKAMAYAKKSIGDRCFSAGSTRVNGSRLS
jgi:serine/threonine-protein kinase